MDASEPGANVTVEVSVGFDDTGDAIVSLTLNGQAWHIPATNAERLGVQLVRASGKAEEMGVAFRELTLKQGWTPQAAIGWIGDRM